MTLTTRRAITAALAGSAITATLMMAAQLAVHDAAPAPSTSTVTTTVTTPVAPCDGPACPPWPSLDY